MQHQIPLPFKLQEDFNFDSFIASGNELVIQSLKNPAEPFIFLWGDTGTGKTHLLQATCQYQAQHSKTASYLPLKELIALPAQVLAGMQTIDLICIDDVELAYGKADWEEALFDLFNQIRQAGGRLIVGSSSSPQHSQAALNDLKSRFNSGLPLDLKPLSDEGCIIALQTRAQKLGLELNQDVAKYLITRFPRDLPTLWRLLNKLDRASLAAQRKLTIPFLKSALSNDI
ncbi:MAG: DnaA regulatory inactivator Hda [Cycloclasticus sp.]|nr:DnaA regulatory inactivator Hda [Cycloclasticus sp.]